MSKIIFVQVTYSSVSKFTSILKNESLVIEIMSCGTHLLNYTVKWYTVWCYEQFLKIISLANTKDST